MAIAAYMKINIINDIQTYLKQIGEYELLDDEQEKEVDRSDGRWPVSCFRHTALQG